MSTESMVTQALEPCPFCGAEGEIEETGGGQASSFAPHYRGNCSQYGCANMVWTTEKAEAITAWNTRTAGQPEREAVLEEALLGIEAVLQATPVLSNMGDDLAQQQDQALIEIDKISQKALAAYRALKTTPAPAETGRERLAKQVGVAIANRADLPDPLIAPAVSTDDRQSAIAELCEGLRAARGR